MPPPLALRGLSRALRVTPRATTSRSAAVNSRVSSGLMKRESDCSRSSSGRKPRSADTASLACRILPSRSETNTGSGALAIMMPAYSGALGRGGCLSMCLVVISPYFWLGARVTPGLGHLIGPWCKVQLLRGEDCESANQSCQGIMYLFVHKATPEGVHPVSITILPL